MSKKKVNIKRADGIVQGYHVGSGVDGITAPILPSNAPNPYIQQEAKSKSIEAANSFKDFGPKTYEFIVNYVETASPALYEEYKNLRKGETLTAEGFQKVIAAVNDSARLEIYPVDPENIQTKAEHLLTNFGRKDYSEQELNMAKVSVLSGEVMTSITNEYYESDMSDAEYAESIAVYRLSQDILNGNLMSKEPWI